MNTCQTLWAERLAEVLDMSLDDWDVHSTHMRILGAMRTVQVLR